MGVVLASKEQEPESGPEALFISALIDSGTYDPKTYNVHENFFHGMRNTHEFCVQYQKDAGEAPPAHLVTAKFPSFPYTPDISPTWAASELISAEDNRNLRKTLSRAAAAIKDEAHGEAISILAEAVRGHKTSISQGAGALDFDLLQNETSSGSVAVPGEFLSKLTKGHPAGELWLIAAQWGAGKSWKLIEHAIAALEDGWDVRFFSLEMTAKEVLTRLHRVALRNNSTLPSHLTLDEMKPLLQEWYSHCGNIGIYGPELGRVDASVIAGSIQSQKTLVCVDYVGRMYSTSGSPATEDYKTVAAISRELCEVAGVHQIPLLAAAQLNRQGSVAGSMDLERDPHLILEVSRISENVDSVRRNTIKKSRNTASNGQWFSMFDAPNGRFNDISNEKALEIKLTEESIHLCSHTTDST